MASLPSRSQTKKKLYRKVNTRTHGVHHGGGKDYSFDRNTKVEIRSDTLRGSMHSKQHHGLDYTPLFKFLLSRVGKDWDGVYSEAVSRLDRSEPIYWMVARCQAEKQSCVRLGENTFYSGLYIDSDKRLAVVDPNHSVEDMTPSCPCCTHTFNGMPFTQAYSP